MKNNTIALMQEKGIQLMTEGYTCAEATLRVLLEEMGADIALYQWAAAGYTGAIKSGMTICGNLFGGTIFLGYLYGQNDSRQPYLESTNRSQAISSVDNLYQGFIDKFGDTDCYKLTGCDWGNRRDVVKYFKDEIYTDTCYKYLHLVLAHCVDQMKVDKEL